MSEKELIDQLAQRMHDAYMSVSRDGCYAERLDALASECLRQMEWARRCVYIVPGGPPEVLASLPLTLAPEGWKP